MKNMFSIVMTALTAFLLFITSFSCAPGRYLRTEDATATEITGTFSLILYGGRHSMDLETVAILGQEGTPYTFEVYAPKYDYKIIKGFPAKEALEKATTFVSFHPYFWRSRLGKIFDYQGNVIGYEVRPLYDPFLFRFPDVLYVDYIIRDTKVVVYIRLRPDVERMLYGDDDPLILRPRRR